MKPIVAIVGRPNVGKSTLFNRLTQSRHAIVEDQPGVTRDRLYADTEWNGRTLTLVDTGGIQLDKEGDTIEAHVTRQAELAIREADVIIFVVDVTDGVTAPDLEVADLLRRQRKPVIVAVNKVENLKREDEALEFWALGLEPLINVSAEHGLGTGDLLDAVVASLPDLPEPEPEEGGPVRVAVIGRPNVGKSSLVNAILGEERVIVSDVPGTTRDAIDVLVERGEDKFLLIDTAGMRRKARVEEAVERYSVMRALRAVERAQVVLIVIDAQDGVTEQDQRIAGYAHENGKACIVVVNKWDLIEKDDRTMAKMTEEVRMRLAFMDYAMIHFVSAKTRARVHRLLPLIKEAAANHARRISTRELNDLVREAVALNPPPSDKGRRLKIFYATQPHVSPPGFVFFVNDSELVHFSYQRYLENQLRQTYAFEGTPINLYFRTREKAKLGERPVRVRRVLAGGQTREIRRAARKRSTE
ncbi:ribosome biogenesis GTPase Der [Symbiobacterium thermophilum]|uniref:ribosome biogenesis GTPase Der n=1 Tax=Symbiobacterium thermophilum TaxID=2734 RepID=UPI0035C69CD1